MKIAVVSDIHGNFVAWQEVLADIQAQGVSTIYCLGDVIGYGAEPQACLASVLEHCTWVVQGNHDYALNHPEKMADMNQYAQQALEWTRQILPQDLKHEISQWPILKKAAGSCLVHGSPQEPLAFHYLLGQPSRDAAFRALTEPLCWIGHTHIPALMAENSLAGQQVHAIASEGLYQQKETCTYVLAPGQRYIINVGSVGQPRGYDPRSCWVLADTADREIHYRFVPYDIAAAQKKIVAAGLPAILAERLAYGQ